jgi:hypothetical protein
MAIETPVHDGDARSQRPLGFPPGSTVDVRQVDDQDWETLRALAVIVISLLVFYLVELVVWIPLEAAYGIRERRHRPAKKVNRPTLRWKL